MWTILLAPLALATTSLTDRGTCTKPATGYCCSGGNLVPGVAASSGACLSSSVLRSAIGDLDRFTGAEPSNIWPRVMLSLAGQLGLASSSSTAAALSYQSHSGGLTLLQGTETLSSGDPAGVLMVLDLNGDQRMDLVTGRMALDARHGTISYDLSVLSDAAASGATWTSLRAEVPLSCTTVDTAGLDFGFGLDSRSASLLVSDLGWTSTSASWPSSKSRAVTRSTSTCGR